MRILVPGDRVRGGCILCLVMMRLLASRCSIDLRADVIWVVVRGCRSRGGRVWAPSSPRAVSDQSELKEISLPSPMIRELRTGRAGERHTRSDSLGVGINILHNIET